MRIALVTPLKPPHHPVPSGDRTFARNIVAALTRAGHHVDLATDYTTWRREPGGYAALAAGAAAEVEAVSAHWRRDGPPDAVIAYHNYHKAPDLIGAPLVAAFDRPYAIVEASRSPRRAQGPWAQEFARADEALFAAHAVAAVSAHDAVALKEVVAPRLSILTPFLDTAPFAVPAGRRDGTLMVSAAMMRGGRKSRSFAVLADVVRRVQGARPQVRLALAGDGPERGRLEPMFPPGTFQGLLEREALAALYGDADVCVWPAIGEAFGFVFLEAQAAGLPVVAGRARGVVDVVKEGETALLADPDDPEALAGHVLCLLGDPARRHTMGEAARAFAAANDLDAGAARLNALLERAFAVHAATGHAPAGGDATGHAPAGHALPIDKGGA